jgi:hypothetical protein
MGSTAIQPEVFTHPDETACPILQIHQKAEPSAVCYWVGCIVGCRWKPGSEVGVRRFSDF